MPASPFIRPLALAVIRHGDRILVFRAEDPSKPEVFYRPLGGGIGFGETGEQAVRRELREEIGAELTNVGSIGALENIFEYHGRPGHEIVLLYAADLVDPRLYETDELDGSEADGAPLKVMWKALDDFHRRDILYPNGLLDLIDG